MPLNEIQEQSHETSHQKVRSPLFLLSDDDLSLVVDLVLQSGSLKGLAKVYAVSYPTIRARLDRVIEKLTAAIEGQKPDPLRDYLADLIRRGVINVDTARQIRTFARHNETRGNGDTP